jgi:hypothetical protein
METDLKKHFLKAFGQAYQARLLTEPKLLTRYSGADWTRVMLGGGKDPVGILTEAAQIYAAGAGEPCTHHQQWYTLDLCVVTPPYVDKTEYWQTKTMLAVEHENGDDVETEMWKLAHWSAALTVCVFYDFNEAKLDDKIYRGDRTVGEVARKDWLARKLDLLSDIVRRVDPNAPERHLLIVGNRTLSGSIGWRVSQWQSNGFAAPTAIPSA